MCPATYRCCDAMPLSVPALLDTIRDDDALAYALDDLLGRIRAQRDLTTALFAT